jgi:four helix bundle protein
MGTTLASARSRCASSSHGTTRDDDAAMNHENTEIYRKAMELADICLPLAGRMPVGYGFMGDQLRRAATSISMQFSEGCRKKSVKERRCYFDGAAGSASEISANVDLLLRAKAIDTAEHARVKDMCDHICAMLFKFH